MHREIQIKQFPIVTTHWLRHETSGLCKKTNSIYIVFYLLYTTMSKWSECAHTSGVWRVCARSGSRLTEGVSEAWCWGNCHRSCCFWTVYSRIMMTYFKQTRLLSCIVFLYERSMYPFHSSVTSQTHMPQLHPPHPASLPPNHVKNNRSRNSLLRHDTGEKKKKESYYDEGLVHE